MFYKNGYDFDLWDLIVCWAIGIAAFVILIVGIAHMSMTCDVEFTDGSMVHSEHYCYAKRGFAYCGADVYSNFKHIRCQ